MKLYLDFNIFVQIQKEVDKYNKKIEYETFLNNTENIDIFYTYAHCEEIARMEDKGERLSLLNYFREITKNKEILHTAFLNGDWINNKFYFFKEDIENYMDRTEQSLVYNESIYSGLKEDDVLHKEFRKNTENVKVKENFFLEYSSDFLQYLEKCKITAKNSYIKSYLELYFYIYNRNSSIFSIEDHLIFSICFREVKTYFLKLNIINCLINLCNKKISFSNFQDKIKKNLLSFSDTEFLIELLMKFIYTKKIATDKNAISKFFDVTHIIFASQCNLFVSGDKKLITKCEMIYNFLGISTKIVYLENIGNDLFKKLDKILKENLKS